VLKEETAPITTQVSLYTTMILNAGRSQVSKPLLTDRCQVYSASSTIKIRMSTICIHIAKRIIWLHAMPLRRPCIFSTLL
jgi:hypothetical protein